MNILSAAASSGGTATFSIRSSSGSVRYVNLPNGTGSATVATGEEVTLVLRIPRTSGSITRSN